MTKDISFSLNMFQKHISERKRERRGKHKRVTRGKERREEERKGKSEAYVTQALNKQFQSINFSQYTIQ